LEADLIKKITVISVLALGLAAPAFGGLCPGCTIYSGTVASGSDISEFGTMESADPNITFTNITFTGDIGNYSSSGFTDPTTGVLFDGVNGNNVANLSGVSSFCYGSNCWANAPNLAVPQGGGYINATLPSNVYAVAFDMISEFSGTAQFEVYVDGYDIGTYSDATLPGSGFFGVVSTTPIWSVEIVAYNNSEWGIDDFEVGTEAAQTPEAATMLIIGLGLLFIRGLHRRLHRMWA